MDRMALWILTLTVVTFAVQFVATQIENNGYILYCPCMGRFGNQAEHFLGSLAFAHGLNRTLVVPPWVEYPLGKIISHQEPYSSYFQLSSLEPYLPVLAMEDFMKRLASTAWPVNKRSVLCYRARGDGGGCSAKEGNPFGPFWDTFNIDFISSFFFGPLSFNTLNPRVAREWIERFPPSIHRVLAFTGAPAAFPVNEDHVHLTQYMEWSARISDRADAYIRDTIGDVPFIGIHLRNGIDWKRACESVVSGKLTRNVFGSAQCLGHRMQHGSYVTHEMCLPSEDGILKQLKETVVNARVKAIFVATDSDPMIEKISKSLEGIIRTHLNPGRDPHLDLAILTKADHFIGNCVSTFSAFVTRYRITHGDLPSSYWAFTPTGYNALHKEL